MNNTLKARKLYEDANIQEDYFLNACVYFRNENTKGWGMVGYIASLIIKNYVEKEYKDDWMPVVKEEFYVKKSDTEGWKMLKKMVDYLAKKKYIEKKLINNINYIRIINDDLFNCEKYKDKELENIV